MNSRMPKPSCSRAITTPLSTTATVLEPRIVGSRNRS